MTNTDMLHAWITLLVLCHGARGFLIHNTHHSLCLEDRTGPGAGAGAVGLGRCNLDSRLQQWVWWNRGTLKNLGSDRCLAGHGTGPVQTMGCQAPGEEEEGAGGGKGGAAGEILWDCEGGRLISVSAGLGLSVDDSRSPALSPYNQHSAKWRSLDEGDICQERLRSKRASKEPEEFEKVEGMDPRAGMAGMTEEQKKFLIWYYRTEDPTTWKFVLLGLSFFCLLVGFLLLGMGSMANRNRRKIAQYKAAAALARQPGGGGSSEELLTLKDRRGPSDLEAQPPGHGPSPSALGGASPSPSPGEILVTWRDGNVSTLYPDPLPEEEKKEEQVEWSLDMEDSRREESVVEDEPGVCNEVGVQQVINGQID